jgi:4-hydroxy-tetrahydrodipicolinate synthase
MTAPFQQPHFVWTALVTPFLSGKVNFADLKSLIEYQITEGIHGLALVGTTGESATLSTDEHLEVIAKGVEYAAGRIPILAGTGANSTTEALELTKEAGACGADGFLVVAPYYNRPSQEGIYRHFAQIAESTTKPIMLYSIPSRCGVEISVNVVKRLREVYPHVFSIKEAGGSCDRIHQLKAELDEDFLLISGDDALTLPFMSLGAHGVVSVASNLRVKPVVDLVEKARAGDYAAARTEFYRQISFFQALFCEPNPGPIKYALFREGLISSPEMRLPLYDISSEAKTRVERVLTGFF